MFGNQTLFIVGAGASKEFGLPTGDKLKGQIASKLDIRYEHGFRQISGDDVIVDALRRHVQDLGQTDINPYLHAGWAIRDAMSQAISIDNFIDAHRADDKIELCGKLAIARSILEAERSSSLWFNRHEGKAFDFRRLQDTWANGFFQTATETVRREEIERAFENVSIITFNYDRCIEYFLVHAIENYYRIPRADAEKIVDKIKIFHPYGRVGALPFQNEKPMVEFAGAGDLLTISHEIKTFTEQVHEESELETLRSEVRHSQTIVFLGFAFHPMNLQLLAPAERGGVERVFATAMGLSRTDASSIEIEIAQWLKAPRGDLAIQVRNDLTCNDLFTEFRRTLARPL